jgi:peptidoglycan/xylan/chitin deacetylase (PgdA/CDA1 family)
LARKNCYYGDHPQFDKKQVEDINGRNQIAERNRENRRKMSVPILMYHSVSDNQRWLWGHLSCPVSVFEDHIQTLASKGFVSISLQDLYDHVRHGSALPSRPVVLTFDDGYLDNWVYAFPILRRYGFKGTIFANPDFVDPTDKLRPNLDDVAAGRLAASSLEATGYLSWAEMAAMEARGVMDIQSHAMTHTWCFSDDRIVDFHHPGDPYPWLAWNASPEHKYLWLKEDQSAFVPFGVPIYTYGKSLPTRRYFPDPRLADFLTKQVTDCGGVTFFQKEGWRGVLLESSSQYRSKHHLDGRRESEEEYQARVRYELGVSKEIIEARLRKRVNFLCWPGGGYNDTTERIAEGVGYLSMTLSSKDPRRSRQDPSRIARLGAPMLQRGIKTLYRSGRYLVYMLYCMQGSRRNCLACKLLSGRDRLLFRIQSA